MDPSITQVSGITLNVDPLKNLHIVNEATEVFSIFLDYIVWRALWTKHPAVIGSIEFAGSLPCPPFPVISIYEYTC